MQFDMAKSSIFASFERVLKAVTSLAPRVVCWPNRERREQITNRFQTFGGIKGIVGAIDGTYIQIKAPHEDAHVYINRKCTYAVTLQAICDCDRKFIDCFAGWPSSVGDRRILYNSPIYQSIVNNLRNYFDEGQFIIGDKAYPVLNWCVPPFIDRGHIDIEEINFNRRHAQTRQVIERAFALLLGRFRRLRYLDMNRMDLLPSAIIVACILHNICIMNEDEFLDRYEEEGMPFVNRVGQADEVHMAEDIDGNVLRRDIARQLMIV